MSKLSLSTSVPVRPWLRIAWHAPPTTSAQCSMMRDSLVREQSYQYFGQRMANVLATGPETSDASGYYVVGAHYDTVAETPGADDNASAVAVLLELIARIRRAELKTPVLFAAFTLEEPPAYLTGHQGKNYGIGHRAKIGK
jgi:Peptidase family M28